MVRIHVSHQNTEAGQNILIKTSQKQVSIFDALIF